jgi:hypothetical protein
MLAWIPRRRVSMAGLRLTGPRLVPVGRVGRVSSPMGLPDRWHKRPGRRDRAGPG